MPFCALNYLQVSLKICIKNKKPIFVGFNAARARPREVLALKCQSACVSFGRGIIRHRLEILFCKFFSLDDPVIAEEN